MEEFLLGLLFAFLFLPIIQDLTSILQSYVDLLISKNNLKIYEIQEEIEKIKPEQEEKLPIGFYPPIEEEPIIYEEEEEDDDNEFGKKKTKTSRTKSKVAGRKKYFNR